MYQSSEQQPHMHPSTRPHQRYIPYHLILLRLPALLDVLCRKMQALRWHVVHVTQSKTSRSKPDQSSGTNHSASLLLELKGNGCRAPEARACANRQKRWWRAWRVAHSVSQRSRCWWHACARCRSCLGSPLRVARRSCHWARPVLEPCARRARSPELASWRTRRAQPVVVQRR